MTASNQAELATLVSEMRQPLESQVKFAAKLDVPLHSVNRRKKGRTH
jgi:hypothetical protein